MNAPRSWSSVSLFVLVLTAPRVAVGAVAVNRDEVDRRELGQTSPVALARCEAADKAYGAGHFEEALKLYASAHEEAPAGAYPARGACRAALATKKKDSALNFCKLAFFASSGNPEDMRNKVAATVGLDPAPTMTDFLTAALTAEAIVRHLPQNVWGYEAHFDVARRLGERTMMESSLAEMRKYGPEHPETKRVEDLIGTPAPPWLWGVRALLLGVVLVTVAHALVRRRRTAKATMGVNPSSPSPSSPLALGIIAFGALVVDGRVAHAALPKDIEVPSLSSSLFHFDEKNPEASVPTPKEQMGNPIEFGYYLHDVIGAAQAAAKAGDHARAARDYRALTKAAPIRALAFSRLCEELELVGDRDNALKACEAACLREGVTVGDYVRTVRLILNRPGALTTDDSKEIKNIITHLAAEKDAGQAPDRFRCELAIRENDIPALEVCSSALAKSAPNAPTTLSFQWALAIAKKDRSAAVHFVELAKKSGMPPEAVERMDAATRKLGFNLIKKIGIALALAAALAALMVFGRRAKAARAARAS